MDDRKTALRCAVAAALGAVLSLPCAAAVTVVGTELPAGSQIAAGAFGIATSGYAPTAANPLYLQFALTGGASWVANPGLACNAYSGGGGGAVAAANLQRVAGGASTAFVTYVVSGVTADAQVTSCTITNGSVQVDSWPLSVTESATITYGNAIVSTGFMSTALLAPSSFFNNVASAGVNTADVTSAFVSFSTTANTATTTYTARVGKIYLRVTDVLQETGSPANANGLSTYVSSITVTVAGDPLAAGGAASVFITSGGGGTSATCAGTLKASQPAVSTNIRFTAFAAPVSDTATYAVCLGVTGGAPVAAGSITIGITATPMPDQSHASFASYQAASLLAPETTLGRITRNGASTSVLALPRSADAGGDQGFLRVYNTSTVAGAVTANVYVDASATGPSSLLAMNCTLAASLPAKSALVLSMPQLEAAIVACGGAVPASGRYRLELNGVFPTMRAQAYVRTGGVLTNVSPDAPIEDR